METNSQEKIDEGLYSRQLYVLGHDAMQKMAKSSVVISSCCGLGVEVAKNLVLAGVKRIFIFDKENVKKKDFGVNFFLRPDELLVKGKLGKVSRLNATVEKLKELNPSCEVVGVPKSFRDQLQSFKKKDIFFKAFFAENSTTVVVAVNLSVDLLLEANKLARVYSQKLVAVNAHGFFAYFFNDFGEKHEVAKKNDQELASFIVASVRVVRENEQLCTEVVANEEQRHGLEVGDWIVLSELQGSLVFLNGRVLEVLTVDSPYVFMARPRDPLEAADSETETASENSGGRAEQVDKPVVLQMYKFGDLLNEIEDELQENDTTKYKWFPRKVAIGDFLKEECKSIYVGLMEALEELRDGTASIKPHKKKYTNSVFKRVEKLTGAVPDSRTEWLQALIRSLSASVVPVNSVAGGIAAQEVLKAVSNKFTPIDQFLFLDFVEAAPQHVFSAGAENKDFYCTGEADDNMVAAFGKTFLTKVAALKVLMVGSGAIGCELLKNLALTGFCTEGELALVDDDVIERSNLSRQFLFRENDVGSPKAVAAAKAAMQMNPNFKARSVHSRFNKDLSGLNTLVSSRDLLFTALDNVEARLFVDKQAILHGKPFFESGTLGLKGNSQPVVPFLSENYAAQRDPEEKAIPVCTLKHYPYKPEHAVHWARDLFDGEFRAQPEACQKDSEPGLINRFFAFSLKRLAETDGESLLVTHKALAASAADLFFDLFVNNVRQLLHSFPADAKNKEGQLFWSGTKRCPTAAVFSLEDALCTEFLESCLKLKCEVLGVSIPETPLSELLTNYEPVPFEPSSATKIPENDEQASKTPSQTETVEENVRTAIAKFASKAVALDFEKDDDTNGHVRFIAAAAQLRAFNYRIGGDLLSTHQVKRIAGRIVPAIATTTAVVAGLAVLEALKYVQAETPDLEQYKSAFVNLSVPLVTMTTPVGPETNKLPDKPAVRALLSTFRESMVVDGGLVFSAWDQLQVPVDSTASGLAFTLEDLENELLKCSWTLQMLTFEDFVVFSQFMNKQKAEERKEQALVEILMEHKKIKEVPKNGVLLKFDLLVVGEDEKEVDLPSLVLKV